MGSFSPGLMRKERDLHHQTAIVNHKTQITVSEFYIHIREGFSPLVESGGLRYELDLGPDRQVITIRNSGVPKISMSLLQFAPAAI